MPVKILLADKSITIQKVVEMLFSGREYDVVCVSDGETALNEATRVVPDVVLVDVDLPRIDGYSFAERLKRTPQFAQTPIILMMSRDDVYDGTKGTQAGILDHIAKPFESQELIGKVKKALGAAPPRAAEPATPSVRPTVAPAAPVRPVPPPIAPLKSTKAAPADIFDIINEAPSPADLARASASAEVDTVYEVEPIVEEVGEPLSREGAKMLPIGAKAMEEMRVGLGLTGGKEESQPGAITYESLEKSLNAAQSTAFKPKTPGTPIAQPTPPPVQQPQITDEILRDMVDKKVASLTKEALEKMPAPQPQAPGLNAAEVRKIAEDMVAKMAKDLVALIPKAQPQLSPETIRSMIAEEVAGKTKETLASMPQPSTLSAGEARGIAEEVVANAAKNIIAQIPPAQPQLSPETIRSMIAEEVAGKTKETLASMPQPSTLSAGEARGIAEEVVANAARNIIAQIPPAQPQISPETLRALVAEEVANRANAVPEQSALVQPPALTASDMWSATEEAVQRIAREYFDKQPLAQMPRISDETLLTMVEAKVTSMTQESLEKMPAARSSDLSPSDMWSMADEAVERIAREFFEKQPFMQTSKQSEESLRSMVEQIAAKTVDSALEKKTLLQQPSISESELRKMAETTVSRIALEKFSDITPPAPKVSEDTVRRGIEEAVMKIAREVARDVIEKVAWNTVPQLAEVMIKEEIERLKAMD